MDETSLRAMFERAVAERPPTPRLVPDSVRAGTRLRKRRRIEAVAWSNSAVALVAAVVQAAAGAFGRADQPPAAPARIPARQPRHG
jgi:CubicO group peptidase (beta-lactamase class C family)